MANGLFDQIDHGIACVRETFTNSDRRVAVHKIVSIIHHRILVVAALFTVIRYRIMFSVKCDGYGCSLLS